MATYKGVSWQPDDEVTSTKLQQMSDNTTWLKDNLILGNIYKVGNGDLVPSPMTKGTSKILRLDAKVKPFNSGTATAWMDLDLDIPPGYTNVPAVIASVADPTNTGTYIALTKINGLHSVTFRITQGDNVQKLLKGNIHAIFVGY